MKQIYSYQSSIILIEDGIVVEDQSGLLDEIPENAKHDIKEIMIDEIGPNDETIVTLIYLNESVTQFQEGKIVKTHENVKQIVPTYFGYFILFNNGDTTIDEYPDMTLFRPIPDDALHGVKYISYETGRYLTMFAAVKEDNTIIFWGWDDEPISNRRYPMNFKLENDKQVLKLIYDEYKIIILYGDNTIKSFSGLLHHDNCALTNLLDDIPTTNVKDIFINQLKDNFSVFYFNGELFEYYSDYNHSDKPHISCYWKLVANNVQSVSENAALLTNGSIVNFNVETENLLVKSADKN